MCFPHDQKNLTGVSPARDHCLSSSKIPIGVFCWTETCRTLVRVGLPTDKITKKRFID